MALLEVKNLNLGFQSENKFFQALYDISFTIEQGKMLALVGESGCGKTMSATSIMQLIPKTARITSGEIFFNGENLLAKNQQEMQKIRGAKIALIPQDPMTSLNPLYTIGNQLLEIIKIHQNISGEAAEKKAIEALEMVQTPNAKSRLKNYPHEFSGGMKQRAIIAMALACNAELLIADEPTTALDVTIQAQIMTLLNDIKNNQNTAILLITHDLALVKENADTIAVMYAGRIVEQAPSEEFFKNPVHPYSKALLNSLPSNKSTKLSTIKGQPPAITQKLDGCKCHPRCEYCMKICRNTVPQLKNINESHKTACHLLEQGFYGKDN